MEQLQQRGPDTGRTYCSGNVALGHRRLSIIDTTDTASQPMIDPTGRYVLVYNGEIFNYQSLSDQYLPEVWKQQGGPLTSSDTEVLLQLLIRFDTECLEWLSGFFAFAFYDREKGTCLLARDRYGKKPLLFHADEDRLVFASEMKALLAYGIPRRLRPESVYRFIQLGYLPPDQSILEEVEKLRPGHFIRLEKTGPQPQQAWYQLQTNPSSYDRLSYEQACDQLTGLMDESVRERMIADVPLGAFLSGGIDSSVIVALASRHTSKLRTFSIGYKDNAFFDETRYAKMVATQYRTEHTDFQLSNDDFLAHIYQVLDYLDEPFADTSALPVFILSHETRRHVTVALSGDGGDEIFAGYNKHAAEWNARRTSLATAVVRAGHPLWSVLPKSRSNRLTNVFRQLYRFSSGARLDARSRYLRWASITGPDQLRNLFAPAFLQTMDKDVQDVEMAAYVDGIRGDDFNEVLLADMKLVLPGDMLVKADLMSMANSLEIRSPFLGHKVVEFAFGLPSSYKINGSMKKRIVQDAFRPLLPAELYNRPKQGFDVPLLGWFRKELSTFIFGDLLAPAFLEEQGIFNPDAIVALKAKLFSANPEDSVEQVWALVVFQYWYKKYLHGAG